MILQLHVHHYENIKFAGMVHRLLLHCAIDEVYIYIYIYDYLDNLKELGPSLESSSCAAAQELTKIS
jgi:hypothetical protein